MSEKIYYLPVEILTSFVKDVLVAAGVPSADAETCTDVIIASDIKGIESHGIGRLKYYYVRIKNGKHQPVTHFEIVREGPTTAVIDGHHGMGMVIARRSMQMAIDKARMYGMGSVAVRNSTHFGIAGYYPLMAVNQGMVGMTFTNARPSTAPTFSVQPVLGTNPIAFAAPTDEEFPFFYDAATPITQRGKIEVLAREEMPIPEGWVINQENKSLTDANEILAEIPKEQAAFLPLGGAGELLGGHKGYGLGIMVEIFSSALQNGSFLSGLTGIGKDGSSQPFKIGHFFMAINIESFTSLAEFKSTTGKIMRQLRSARKAPGHERIYTAGEKEYEMEKLVRSQGVPVIPNLQKDIKYLQQELGLTQYQFPF